MAQPNNGSASRWTSTTPSRAACTPTTPPLLDQRRDQEDFDIITAARKLHPEDPEVFDVIGEALLNHGHPQQAARWFTAGLVNQLGHLTDLHVDDLRHHADLAELAQGRYRARQAIGLPHDHVDELAKEIQPAKTSSSAVH
jgi:hypothetical protein